MIRLLWGRGEYGLMYPVKEGGRVRQSPVEKATRDNHRAPRVVIAAESFSLERGGAARVARLTAGAAVAEGLDARLLALGDRTPVADFGLDSRTAAGSRARFVLECRAGAFTTTHFLYNHLGIGRAHWRRSVLRRPYAVWLHGVDAWGNRMLSDYGRVAKDANQLIAVSQHTRRRAAERVPAVAEAAVCWLATEEDDLPPQRPDPDGPPTVLILSRIDRSEMQKGHIELIQAWPAVRAAVPDARLLIAGGGDGLDSLRTLAASSPAAAGIEFLGFVSQSTIDDVWSRAHVYAMPSRQEGFGLVYVEAMRQGLSVIASVHDAGQEVNAHGVTGYNVDLDRRGDLVDHLVVLLKDQDLGRRMGDAAQLRWREHFRRSAFLNRIRPVLSRFLDA
jgi:phosphatidylinositol alpha-1,6-mannosyltransferase